jgi:acetyltransferase-like isoleucine patch superfamily enzyme
MKQLDPSFTLHQASARVSHIVVGDYTYTADAKPNLISYSPMDVIVIGKFCSLANEVTIFGGGEHRFDWVSSYPIRIAFGIERAGKDGHPTSKGPTVIGNDVYLGYRAIVLSGVRIGDGAVVAAGSVVTQNVPAYAIVGGNPARVIKMRMSDECVQYMLAIKWWDWPLEKIKKSVSFICSDDLHGFIEYALEKQVILKYPIY